MYSACIRIIATCLLLIPVNVWAIGNDSLLFSPVFEHKAFTSRHKHLNKGCWEPLSYGLTSRIELQTYPIAFLVMPNLGIKINYAKNRNTKLQWASTHSISYYSSWLKFWQGEGAGAMITPQISIPEMYMLKNGLVSTYSYSGKHIASIAIEYSAILGQKMDPMYSVDLPLVFPRFAPAFLGPVITLKANAQGVIYKRLQYMTHINYHTIHMNEFAHFYEVYGSLVYVTDFRLKLCAGPNLVYGTYPFGKQWNLLPYINLYYTLKPGKKS